MCTDLDGLGIRILLTRNALMYLLYFSKERKMNHASDQLK